MDEWSMHHFSKKRPQYQPQSQDSFNFVKLPGFHGSNDSSLYLDWEAKVEHIFHVYKVTEDEKVRLASLVFLDYAKHWWHHLVLDIGINKRPPVVSCYNLKTCMRARFVPPPSRKEHLLKFQRLPQGHRSVDEYFKDFETTLTKMNMHANEESKIKWFVSGLRREIKDFVKLHEYSSLKKVVHLAIKVESHLLKTAFKNIHDDGFYKSSRKDANKISTKTYPSNFSNQPTSKPKVSTKNPSTPKSPTKTSKTKCFKCLSFGHIAAKCPFKETILLNEIKQDHHKTKSKREIEREKEGQDTMGLIPSPPRCFPSLYFSFSKHSKYLTFCLRSLGMLFQTLLKVLTF